MARADLHNYTPFGESHCEIKSPGRRRLGGLFRVGLLALALGVGLALATELRAQNGDKAGEAQIQRVDPALIPPAPPLSPAEALKTFALPEGYRIELVASEPMVESPVAAVFDPDGRLYVLEMRGFMPNADGAGENEPKGRISVLEDVDGDGKMDRSHVFMDGLVMPRAISLVQGGLLVAEPPVLWFVRDRDGDGKADEKTMVVSDYGDRKNPEHTANGLVTGMNNWVYSLYHGWRYRWMHGKWEREAMPNRVQWGLAQDDFGRLFFTSNSDLLRSDLFPSHYVGKRAPTAKLSFLNVQVAKDQSVWPGRVNAGVNRGYQPKVLRDNGRLSVFTAACGTTVFRGDRLPEDTVNNVFVCEPSGNLVRRCVLKEQGEDGMVEAVNAYAEKEFLTSTDERFRPVNLLTGPDGTLYVVDMYRGIIQHRIYMTSYLRKQVESRDLAQPLNQGRIYRVVHASKKPGPRPALSKSTPQQWVETLSHSNGWWRDTAQRLLVEQGDVSVVASLKEMARKATDPRYKLHALWTLEGLGGLDADTVQSALTSTHPKIQRVGIQLGETLAMSAAKATNSNANVEWLTALSRYLNEGAVEVRIQAALSLGALMQTESVKVSLAQATNISGVHPLVREAASLALGAMDVKASTNRGPAVVLSAADQKRFDAGKELFMAVCAGCHQPHGMGQEGLAPPLVGSEWVAGSPERIIRIVLHGLRGPIKVKGQIMQLEMPPLGVLDDDSIANVLTYVRKEWGHTFSTVVPEQVQKIRAEYPNREEAWTVDELMRLSIRPSSP